MRFGGHQTFHLREGWPLKGLEAIAQNPSALSDENAVVELGVGKNQVESISYWLTALQLATKEQNGMLPSEHASLIMSNDPYLELDGSLLYLHYLLSTNKDEATTWYWFFNKFGATEFDAESLKVYLQTFVQGQTDKAVRPETIAREINVLLKTYREADYGAKGNPETENPSPFSRFAMISNSNNKLIKNKIKTALIPSQVFVALVYLFWSCELGRPKTMQLEELVTKEMSPGLTLGLNTEDVLFLIEKILSDFPGQFLEFSRTGGYMIVTVDEKSSKNAMQDYYNTHTLEAN